MTIVREAHPVRTMQPYISIPVIDVTSPDMGIEEIWKLLHERCRNRHTTWRSYETTGRSDCLHKKSDSNKKTVKAQDFE